MAAFIQLLFDRISYCGRTRCRESSWDFPFPRHWRVCERAPMCHVLALFAFTQVYPTLLVIKSYLHQLLLLRFLWSGKHEWSGSELRCKRWHQSLFRRIKKSRWWMSLMHWFHSQRALVSEPLVHIRQAMRAQCLIYSPVTRATHKRGEFEHRAACSCHLHPVWFIVALMIFSLWENASPSPLVFLSEWGLEMAK